jgi:hypothetical protein
MQSDLRDCFKRFLYYLGADELSIEKRTAQRAGLDWLDKPRRNKMNATTVNNPNVKENTRKNEPATEPDRV